MLAKSLVFAKRQIFHEISAFPISHVNIRCFSVGGATVSWVNVNEIQNEYPFIKQFLYKSKNEDIVKSTWSLIDDYAVKCQNNPFISTEQFDFIRQRYGTSLFFFLIS